LIIASAALAGSLITSCRYGHQARFMSARIGQDRIALLCDWFEIGQYTLNPQPELFRRNHQIDLRPRRLSHHRRRPHNSRENRPKSGVM
jgi:hypothetical protein